LRLIANNGKDDHSAGVQNRIDAAGTTRVGERSRNIANLDVVAGPVHQIQRHGRIVGIQVKSPIQGNHLRETDRTLFALGHPENTHLGNDNSTPNAYEHDPAIGSDQIQTGLTLGNRHISILFTQILYKKDH
jgi:hypothetical protein